jgi:hypothetical protein
VALESRRAPSRRAGDRTSARKQIALLERLRKSTKGRGTAFAATKCNAHVIAQTVARVRAQVRSCEVSGGQRGTGAGFLRVLRFPLPILIISTAPQSPSCIIWGWYNRPGNGRRTKWTQSHPTPRNKRNYIKRRGSANVNLLVLVMVNLMMTWVEW